MAASSFTRWTLRLLVLTGLLAQTATGVYVNYEGKQTHPIRLSPSGNRLFAVNTPDARLSVFDVSNADYPILIAEIPVGLEPGSVHPLTEDEAWVVNELSDSVSIVSVSKGMVVDTLAVKDEPADVVFARGRAFVSAARRNEIHVFDITNHQRLAVIPLRGENPRALAVGPGGTNVYAAFALSGNRTTLIPPTNAPPQPPPTVITNPPPQVGLIVDATDTNGSSVITYTMPDNDVVEIHADSMTVVRYFSRVGTVNLGLAVRPGNGDLFVANTDARNLIRFEPNLRGHLMDNRVTRITMAGAVTPIDLNPGIDYGVLPNPAAQSIALAQPTDIAFDPSGDFSYVAAFGTDRIAKVDPNGTVLARIEVGPAPGSGADPRNKRGPRGVALHAPAGRLYVLNRLANSLTVIDTTTDTVIRELSVGSHDPTPEVVRQGRGFLYDAKLSGNGTVSCAGCHVDGEMDMIAWDLGDPGGQMITVTTVLAGFTVLLPMHPMKGPMTTQTLRGLKDSEPLHWRGDRTDFLKFNHAFDTLLGGSDLSPADMQAYMDFIESIAFPPNPNQNLDRTLPVSFAGGNPAAGRNTFINEQYQPLLTCNACHVSNPGAGSNMAIIPAAALQESQDFKVPHLRNVYQKLNFDKTNGAVSVGGFGIVHDGLDPDLFTFLSRPVFGSFAADATRKRNLNAFVLCFDTGTAPAVGYARTADPGNATNAALLSEWSMLEGQAAISNIDLVVKGRVGGVVRSFLYNALTGQYQSDGAGFGPMTRAQLLAQLQPGEALTPLGVPFGSGQRMGVDRDDDGTPDLDAPPTELRGVFADQRPLLFWSTNAWAQVLEASDSLTAPHWSTVTDPRGIEGDEVVVTNQLPADQLFFRLRRPW